MKRSPWIIWVNPKFNDKSPYKRKAEGDFETNRRKDTEDKAM